MAPAHVSTGGVCPDDLHGLQGYDELHGGHLRPRWRRCCIMSHASNQIYTRYLYTNTRKQSIFTVNNCDGRRPLLWKRRATTPRRRP